MSSYLPPMTAIRPDLPLVTTAIPVEQLTREHIGRHAVIPGYLEENGSRTVYDSPITDLQYERVDGQIVAVLVKCRWSTVRLPVGETISLRETEEARRQRLATEPIVGVTRAQLMEILDRDNPQVEWQPSGDDYHKPTCAYEREAVESFIDKIMDELAPIPEPEVELHPGFPHAAAVEEEIQRIARDYVPPANPETERLERVTHALRKVVGWNGTDIADLVEEGLLQEGDIA